MRRTSKHHPTDTHDPWFVAQLKPNSATIAQRNLARQGITSFIPSIKTTQVNATRMVTKDQPLFPGYIFVQPPIDPDIWRKINSTRGITRLICSNINHPTPLPEEFISGLLARCGDDHLIETFDTVKPGDSIRIIAGPFADFITQVEHKTADERLQVLLEVMGQTVRVEISPSSVIKRR